MLRLYNPNFWYCDNNQSFKMPNHSICSQVPSRAHSDAGVAGTGVNIPTFYRYASNFTQVLLSFIITAGLAILLSALIILRQLRKKSSPSSILCKMLNSFSDQQLITGIGIQSVGLAKIDTMVPYHFFIIWMLGLLSTATHLSALLALVQGFKRDWVLRWIRQFLSKMFLASIQVKHVLIIRSVC